MIVMSHPPAGLEVTSVWIASLPLRDNAVAQGKTDSAVRCMYCHVGVDVAGASFISQCAPSRW